MSVLKSSGLRQIKKLLKNQSKSFWVTYKFYFIQDPQIPNFYLANLVLTHALFGAFDSLWAVLYEKVRKTQNFLGHTFKFCFKH